MNDARVDLMKITELASIDEFPRLNKPYSASPRILTNHKPKQGEDKLNDDQ